MFEYIRRPGVVIHRGLLAIAMVLMAGASAFGRPEVIDLRCEKLKDPLGIDTTQPRLSWIISGSDRALQQRAYQVLVASSLEKLKADKADLWDSGRVQSEQSILVAYAGKPLRAHAECFWKVRVWYGEQDVTSWSPAARWTMGMLAPSDWHAKWIGLEGENRVDHLTNTSWIWFPTGSPEKAAPLATNYFRRVVTLPADREIKRAGFHYTGDNEARGWINGFDVGARRDFRVVKDNDITGRLEPGQSYVFGITGRNLGTNDNPAGVVGIIEIEFKSGPPLVIPTDDKWKVSDREMPGWTAPNFDDAAWVAAQKIGPVGMEPWGEVRVSESRRQPARWLRKEFAVERKIKRATVSYSGLGLSELYLNGAKVGDAVLSPALSQYDKRAYYVTQEVTKQLKRGPNAIGVILGGGRFYADRSKVFTGTVSFGWPKLILQLRIEYSDGSVSELISDESWELTLDGPILANSEYDGEEYDARKELGNWSKPGYATPFQYFGAAGLRKMSAQDPNRAAAPHWQPAQLVSAPPGALCAQMIEPIRVTQIVPPVSFNEVKPGVFVYDLGQNIVGWCRLRVKGTAGTTVTLRHAETLNPDGTLYTANLRGAQATDRYTLRGKGREYWEPRFTYHGFRYVEVTGMPGIASLAAIEGRVIHDDLGAAGEFKCSNDLLNRIHRNVFWGTRGNYRSLPTDCPQRDERQGWLGDRSEECRGETYLFDIAKLYPKWLQDIRDTQRESGSVPDVAPAYWPIYSDNVTWPSTLIIAPEVLHRQYGDHQPVADAYDSAKKWLTYMAGFFTNGIIAKDSYGDWCVPPEDLSQIHSKDPARQTDRALLATAYFYHDLQLMEGYARLLGKPDDAGHFVKRAAEIKQAFNRRFLDRAKGYYDNGSQTSCVLPLAFGLVPEDLRPAVFAHLVEKIEKETKGHVGTGLIGGQHLMRVLSDHGRPDLAYRLATQTNYPSWGYMISQGATTIWELWNGNTADPAMNSGNHVMLVGDLGIWLYEYLAGIAADPTEPGFKHMVMKPQPVGDLKFVRASHQSPYGRISSEWRKASKRFEWDIELPANTSATVYVPKMPRQSLTESGRGLGEAKGVKLLRGEGDRIVLQLGSGKFHLRSE